MKYRFLFKFWLIGFFLLCLFFVSCRSSKVVYNPDEVAYLSRLLKVRISDTDGAIPLYAESSLWLGVPYRYGGTDKRGIDCSGFVCEVFYRVYGKHLERSSEGQARLNVDDVSKRALLPGDLVFFGTGRRSKKINHVGIFLKDGYFIHASTSQGVIVSRLGEEYYLRHWVKGGRVRF